MRVSVGAVRIAAATATIAIPTPSPIFALVFFFGGSIAGVDVNGFVVPQEGHDDRNNP
jgi:hypothetical protein